MKVLPRHQSRQQGSALIISLVMGVILLVVAASYLTLIASQKSLVTRSQTWNAAMTMAEAGIEEGLAQVNASNGFFYAGSVITNGNFSFNGWGGTSPVFGPKSHNILGGSYTALIRMDEASSPTIYATGYTTVPVVGGTISRAVRITTTLEPLIPIPLGARHSINFNGNGIATDSYDSTKPSLSTNGAYDPTKTSTNGSVASIDGIVNLGQHTINGSLYLGPTATYSGNGNITGTTNYNFNVQFPDVQLPPGATGWPAASPTITKVAQKNNNGSLSTNTIIAYHFTSTGNYIINQDRPVVVDAGVKVTLNVTSTTFSGSGMYISGGVTNSGSATLYFNGPSSVSIAGNTAVDASNQPKDLWYFGLPSLTSITFSGTSSFNGVIYAPEAVLTLNGGGNNIGITGSAIVGSISMNGHYNFHYDESLARYGLWSGYTASSWQELY
jgi:hypothetical protein